MVDKDVVLERCNGLGFVVAGKVLDIPTLNTIFDCYVGHDSWSDFDCVERSVATKRRAQLCAKSSPSCCGASIVCRRRRLAAERNNDVFIQDLDNRCHT